MSMYCKNCGDSIPETSTFEETMDRGFCSQDCRDMWEGDQIRAAELCDSLHGGEGAVDGAWSRYLEGLLIK